MVRTGRVTLHNPHGLPTLGQRHRPTVSHLGKIRHWKLELRLRAQVSERLGVLFGPLQRRAPTALLRALPSIVQGGPMLISTLARVSDVSFRPWDVVAAKLSICRRSHAFPEHRATESQTLPLIRRADRCLSRQKPSITPNAQRSAVQLRRMRQIGLAPMLMVSWQPHTTLVHARLRCRGRVTTRVNGSSAMNGNPRWTQTAIGDLRHRLAEGQPLAAIAAALSRNSDDVAGMMTQLRLRAAIEQWSSYTSSRATARSAMELIRD